MKPADNVVLCDMLPTKNDKLGLWSFSWENLHTCEVSPTRFHRVQGDELGIPSLFEKFKKIKNKYNLYYNRFNEKSKNITYCYYFYYYLYTIIIIIIIINSYLYN